MIAAEEPSAVQTDARVGGGDDTDLVDTASEVKPGVPSGHQGARPRTLDEASFGVPAGWWPIAFGAEVKSSPQAFRLGARRLAVYRDRQDVVRAVDDRCPHRRMPLSMGRLTERGDLQCGYHGWCFDGATGQCTAIPNLAPHERVSPAIRVAAYAVAERLGRRPRRREAPHRPAVPVAGLVDGDPDAALTLVEAALVDGMVHVWTGSDAVGPYPVQDERADPGAAGQRRLFAGKATVRAPWGLVADALLWNPGRMLGLGRLLGAGEEQSEPSVTVADRTVTACRERLSMRFPRVSSFDSALRHVTVAAVTTLADTGLTRAVGEDADGSTRCRVVVALTPISTARTIVRWRGEIVRRALWHHLQHLPRLLPGAAARRIEACVDAVEDTVDIGVDHLRKLRLASVDGAP